MAVPDKDVIQGFNETFLGFIHAKDVDSIVGFYTAEALLMPPGSPMIKGHDSIRTFWNGFIDSIGRFALKTVEVKPLGDQHIQEAGEFTLNLADISQAPISGKYIVVWEKIGEKWKFSVDIWNTFT